MKKKLKSLAKLLILSEKDTYVRISLVLFIIYVTLALVSSRYFEI